MTFRWGIAGPGRIGADFATGLAELGDAPVVAVGSRSAERARAFADQFGAANSYGSYEGLAADPDVDIVYVATPHSRHCDDAILFLEAGKHVLCEKPFAVNEAQGQRMVAAARANGRFVMEAMWTRFLPAYRVLAELLASKEIGDPLFLDADFGFRREIEPTHRLFDIDQAGGSVLDLGVYPVQLASLVFGAADRVIAGGNIGVTGVDEMVAAVLQYDGGGMAVVKSAIRTEMACTARISGTTGMIEIPAPMHRPSSLIVRKGADVRVIDAGWEGQGLKFQAVEVHRCISEGLAESPVMPHAETLSIARTLDAMRAAVGMSYPGE